MFEGFTAQAYSLAVNSYLLLKIHDLGVLCPDLQAIRSYLSPNVGLEGLNCSKTHVFMCLRPKHAPWP